MTLTIEVFYSFQSPYSYLALDQIYALESDYDVDLLWQPFSAKAAGQPITPTPVIPEKLSYLFEDTKRFADELGLPLKFPEGWPEGEFDPGRATRGAIVAGDMGVLMEYNIKMFNKWWGLGENPNDEAFTTQLCEDLDIDLGEFLSKVSSSDTRERVKGIYKRGKKFDVFDTPTFVIDKERFVGIDKIPFLRARLKKLGLERPGKST
jgi:2-hydroxychromene-2-carboxylate isomerase